MGIRIDGLPPAAGAQPDHEIPAIRSGETVKLTADQLATFITALIKDGAPPTLDTIKKLATAIGNDPNFAATTAALIGAKADAAATTAALANRVRVDAAQAFSNAEKGRAIANIAAGTLSGFRDKLINGDGQINQRTYTTVADDAYWCDRHYVLTQTAAITPTVITDVADSLPFMMRLTQTQATAQRMGNAQIVEASDAKRLRGKKVTLGGKLRSSLAQVIRFAVLEWTGTADAPTSDVVQLWTSATYAPGGFFLGANLTVSVVGSITLAANAITDFSLLADASSACNNLIVFCWTEGTAAQNSTLDMAWGLVEGDASAEKWPYGTRHPQQEMALCQRYGEAGNINFGGFRYASNTSGYSAGDISFAVKKRVVPSVAFSGVTYAQCSAASAVTVQNSKFSVSVTPASAGVNFQVTAGAYFADSEL
jgi:hypothetical protein